MTATARKAVKTPIAIRRRLVPCASAVFAIALTVPTIETAAQATKDVNVINTPSVEVVNPTANPVPTQNVGGGAATAVGQTASQIINLFCDSSGCQRIFPDGFQRGGKFSVPTSQALVITDFQWDIIGSPVGAGNYDNVAVTVNGSLVTRAFALTDGSKVAAATTHLGTGIVAAPGASVGVTAGFPGVEVLATLQGYLVPNQ